MARPPSKPFGIPRAPWNAVVAPTLARLPAQPGQPGQPIDFETQNYHLRSLRPADIDETFVEWLRDKDILQGLNLPDMRWTVEKLRGFVQTFDNRSRFLLGIFCRSPRIMIGFYTIDIALLHKWAQLTAGIGNKEYWGRNVLYETGEGLLNYLYERRDVEKVTAHVLTKNKRILINFANSVDFFYEGRLRRQVRTPDGERSDVAVFSAFKGIKKNDNSPLANSLSGKS